VVNGASSLVKLTEASLGTLPTLDSPTATGAPPETAFRPLTNGVDGNPADSAALRGTEAAKTGIYALNTIDPAVFNIMCLPAAANLDPVAQPNFATPVLTSLLSEAIAYCESKRAFLIVDIPAYIDSPARMIDWSNNNDIRNQNAAAYFPRLVIADRLNENRPLNVAASGTLAGLYARIDATRGVWKAPAGTEASLRGASLAVKLTDLENGMLNPLGLNGLRNFAIFGNISWGARTLEGADQQASEWKYIPVRRMALFIEESLFEGTKWVVFEPNDEPLWSQIRLNIGAFMQNLFRQGAFQGTTPREAYFVKCDKETTTQNDINLGIVNIIVGFAPLKPAEFVVIKLQQMAGQVEA
jgi:phage tail sheath protein FI